MAIYSINNNDQTRQVEIESTRKDYDYAYLPNDGSKVDKIVVAKQFQKRDKASFQWTAKLVLSLFSIRHNTEKVLERGDYNVRREIPKESKLTILNWFKNNDLTKVFLYYNPDMGPVDPDGKAKDIGDYQRFFQSIKKPYNYNLAEDDRYFAFSYVGGANPTLLQRARDSQIINKIGLDQARFQNLPNFSGDSLNDAINEGRIFFVDYEELSMLKNGVHPQNEGTSKPQVRKYIFAPVVIFGISKNKVAGSREIEPICIKCSQNSSTQDLYFPSEGYSWQSAKLVAWAAHNSHHEMLAHLAYTHLMIEPIAVSMRRQMHPSHPIYGLLTPHFEGTMPINSLAVNKLILPGESVDRLVGSEVNSNYALIGKSRENYSFRDNFIPVRFARLGIGTSTDKGALDIYPYRDDALSIWSLIKSKWVTPYVNYYYKSDGTVTGDRELQAWALEANQSGRVKDFTANGRSIASRSELIDILTMIIFTAGPQHAAVNFAQKSDMSFVPAAPLAGYKPATFGKAKLTKQDWLDMLPPVDVGLRQLQTATLLGSVYHTRLGHYPNNHFEGDVAKLAKQFKSALADLDKEIDRRNQTRGFKYKDVNGRSQVYKYEHLKPKNIPQSINI